MKGGGLLRNYTQCHVDNGNVVLYFSTLIYTNVCVEYSRLYINANWLIMAYLFTHHAMHDSLTTAPALKAGHPGSCLSIFLCFHCLYSVLRYIMCLGGGLRFFLFFLAF